MNIVTFLDSQLHLNRNLFTSVTPCPFSRSLDWWRQNSQQSKRKIGSCEEATAESKWCHQHENYKLFNTAQEIILRAINRSLQRILLRKASIFQCLHSASPRSASGHKTIFSHKNCSNKVAPRLLLSTPMPLKGVFKRFRNFLLFEWCKIIQNDGLLCVGLRFNI